MGEGGLAVPADVARIRIHPSVTVIPEAAFRGSSKLEEVELCDGLLEIGIGAFRNCIALKRVSIPSSVTKIGIGAFGSCSKLEEVELNEGLREIGVAAFLDAAILKQIQIPPTVTIIDENTFNGCLLLKRVELSEGLLEIRKEAFHECRSLKTINFPSTLITIGDTAFFDTGFVSFRVPPSFTRIPQGLLLGCERLLSLELPESVTEIEPVAFASCKSLRNIALLPGTLIGESATFKCRDLELLFDTAEMRINSLASRFDMDRLPIHKMIYYQLHNNMTLDQLNDLTTLRKRTLGSNVNPTGNLQDRLGMTPLHIMACSTVQNIEFYRVLIEKYPDTLITEDRWGALPLLYAVWGDAPDDIIQFLVKSYQSIHPKYENEWIHMVGTLASGDAPKEVIQNLFHIQREYFPDQNIDWCSTMVDGYTDDCLRSEWSDGTFSAVLQCSISTRLETIGVKQWRDYITDYVTSSYSNRETWLLGLKHNLGYFESEYSKLKEYTTLLELALWKHKMDEHCQASNRRIKKLKIEKSHLREQCRINCGADIVIENVLPYLVLQPGAEVTKIESVEDLMA